jgi:hypothetical protein
MNFRVPAPAKDEKGFKKPNGVLARNTHSRARSSDRDTIGALHKEQSNLSESGVARTAQLASSGLSSVYDSSMSLLNKSCVTINDFLKTSSQKPNMQGIILIVTGLSFGLFFLRDCLNLFNKKQSANKAPFLIKLLKLITGSTICVGSLKALTKGKGFSNNALIAGIAAFLGLNSTINVFDDNSFESKFLKTLGLRDGLTESLNDLQTENILPG